MFQILHIKYKTANIANVHVMELLELNMYFMFHNIKPNLNNTES